MANLLEILAQTVLYLVLKTRLLAAIQHHKRLIIQCTDEMAGRAEHVFSSVLYRSFQRVSRVCTNHDELH